MTLLLLQAVDDSLTPHLLSDSYHVVAFVYMFVKSLHASMFKLALREKSVCIQNEYERLTVCEL